ncbi:hypothetical protein CALCODRAFT_133925 [Calocera cornea HHB12733]|uniref:DUF6533 domain-containing protein n=1 Tax=Calocera cornea HHB12733 TaxID=1353952 RepID=A0A165CVL5_9BASI|nr:hypothetical protein CALCODRAFT_133925 [Calocera cornea HHB12733]
MSGGEPPTATTWITTDVLANLQGRWASSALFLYEIFITTDQEVELVWRGKWTLPKALYVLSRYGGMAFNFFVAIVSQTDHNNAFCDVFNSMQYFLFILISSSSDLLLLLRVCALYNGHETTWGIRDRWLRTFLLCFFGIILGVDIGLWIWDFKEAVPGSLPPLDDNYGCLGRSGSPLWIYCISVIGVLALNVMMFTLTMIKLLPNWRLLHMMTMETLHEVVIRDGAVYFGLVLASSTVLTTMIFSLGDRPGIEMAALPWSSVVIPIAACRLYLNLRSQGHFSQGITGFTIASTVGSTLRPYQARFWRQKAAVTSDSWDATVELAQIRSPGGTA